MDTAKSVHLVLRILAARKPREISSANAAANKYLKEHPEDMNVRFALEQLGMMADAVGMTLPDSDDLIQEETADRGAPTDS